MVPKSGSFLVLAGLVLGACRVATAQAPTPSAPPPAARVAGAPQGPVRQTSAPLVPQVNRLPVAPVSLADRSLSAVRTSYIQSGQASDDSATSVPSTSNAARLAGSDYWNDSIYQPGPVPGGGMPPLIPPGGGAVLPPSDARAFMPGNCVVPGGPGPGFGDDWLALGRWYFLADAIALRRNQFGSPPFATLDNTVVLSTQPRDFPFRYGMRLLAGYTFSPWLRVEGLYFGLTNWQESLAVRDSTPNALGGTGNIYSRISNFGNPAAIPGVDYDNLATLNYHSSLDNAEINLRHRLITPPCFEASFLVGLRYINIRENLDFFTSSTSPAPTGATNFVNTQANNNLFGIQLGETVNVPIYDAWWIGLDVKGALCANSANQHTQYTNTTSTTQTFNGSKGLTDSSLVGDIALAINCQCTDHIVWRFGYQALWVNGLALASQNVERNYGLLTLGPANLAHNGSVVYHGPNAGVIITW